tara:strand:- start:96 stop:707 length:612 start_codon:yes stop_codon:yes gene_type:complete
MPATKKLLLMIILQLVVVSTTLSVTIGYEAPDFCLQTADSKTHQLHEMRGSVIFLVAGNRKLRKEDNQWGEAIMADFKRLINHEKGMTPILRCYIIGNMNDVPKFISKQFIKKQLLKKPPPVPLLLDWEGEVHQQYKIECKKRKKPSLYIVDQQGKIVFHQYSKFNRQTYHKIRQLLDKLLSQSNITDSQKGSQMGLDPMLGQ